MTLRALALACCILASAHGAHAQQARSAVTPPIDASEGVPAPLQAPPLPTVPAELRANVDTMRTRLERLGNRCQPHEPRPRSSECSQWVSEISATGLAGAHAIGQTLAAVAVRRSRIAIDSVAPWLDALGASGEPVAVPYVLWFLSREIPWHAPEYGDSENYAAGFRALATLTGNDLAPWPEWQDGDLSIYVRWAGDALHTWTVWWQSHRNQPRATQLADGLARARRDLASRDTARRWAAIERLYTSSDDHAAAQASLGQLLGSHRLSRAGRDYIERWTREHSSSSPPPDPSTQR